MKTAKAEVLNLMADNPSEIIGYAENLYKLQISKVAKEIEKSAGVLKIIAISGPSSAGKTWTSKLLSRELERLGISPLSISLDCFFKNREDNDILPNGKPDFESISALDIKTYKLCMKELLDKRKTKLPHFNFVEGKRDRYDKIELPKNGVLILEGIHALNPLLTPDFIDEATLRVAINAQTSFECRNGVCITNRQLRLIRRIIRDYRYRGNSVDKTLDLWPEVVAGERKYILPYFSKAKYKLDTTHLYEPMIYRTIAEKMLKESVVPEHKETVEKLLDGLSYFTPLSPELTPDDSLLVEFIR